MTRQTKKNRENEIHFSMATEIQWHYTVTRPSTIQPYAYMLH